MAGMDKAIRSRWLCEHGWEDIEHEWNMKIPLGWRRAFEDLGLNQVFFVYDAIDLHAMLTGASFEQEVLDADDSG